MANEKRLRSNAMGGKITDNPLTAGAVAMNSDGLAALMVVGATEHAAVILDPDGIFGAPEVAWVTAHTSGATTATIVRGQEGTTARQHDRDVPWVHGPTSLGDYDQMALLARTEYGPGSNTALNTTSTTLVDVDATNLLVAFVAPPSGRVAVALEGIVTSATDDVHFGLREAAATVGLTKMLGRPAGRQMFRATIEVSGLVAGSAHTYKWAWAVASAVTATFSYGPGGVNVFPKARMEVWAVNTAT